MSRFVIEIQNGKYDAPAFVHPGRLIPCTERNAQGEQVPVMRDGKPVMTLSVTATGVLVLHPGTRQNPSAVRVTSEQFREFSYEIEAKAEGKYGCEKEIEIYAVDADTGEKVRYSYAQAAELVEANLNDDAAALADQKRQDEEIQKLADSRDEEEKRADAEDLANSVAASMQG